MMTSPKSLKRYVAVCFLRREEGAATVMALFLVLIVLVVGGVAVDFNKVMSERTRLQIAADTAAHSALYTREKHEVAEARTQAVSTVKSMLPEGIFGSDPIITTDVIFGDWDEQSLRFIENGASKNAVWVRAEMTEERANPSRNLLLQVIGYDSFDVGVEAVYTTYHPPCLTEGFVAEEVVDIQSNNSFTDGFCIHANDYVRLNQQNYFESGTVVSMPELDKLSIPRSGFEENQGLATALRPGVYRLRLLNQLPDIINSFWTANGKHLPPYVSAGSTYEVSKAQLAVDPEGHSPAAGNGLTPNHFMPSSVNFYNCSPSEKVTLKAGTYSSFLFVSDCEIAFSQGVILEDVVIATTNLSATSLSSPAGLNIGRNDNCAPGGGATLMTLGGVNIASSLNVFGGQILAIGDINFAANADGMQGVSFVSYGDINGNSNMNMGYCQGQGMENAFRADYYRLVE
jgi:Flp pilus assembly protein TadG